MTLSCVFYPLNCSPWASCGRRVHCFGFIQKFPQQKQKIEYFPTTVALLAQQGIQTCFQHFGILPSMLIVPYDSNQIKILCAAVDDWAILCCTYSGHIDCHYPKHLLLTFFKEHPVIFPKSLLHNPFQEPVSYSQMGLRQAAVLTWWILQNPSNTNFLLEHLNKLSWPL